MQDIECIEGLSDKDSSMDIFRISGERSKINKPWT